MKRERNIYYNSFDEDVVVNSNQDFVLADDYRWIDNRPGRRVASFLVYALAYAFSFFYAKLALHCKVVNRGALKAAKGDGYFVYCNHTQPVGDVFVPAFLNRDRRIYTVVSQANYGLPVIGKILPYLGALPIPSGISGMKKFTEAVSTRVNTNHCVIIYPEGHVWPWYTGIRPFGSNAFHYPVVENKPVFTMTTTYQKRRLSSKPRATYYIDGPFYADGSLSRKDQKEKLCKEVSETMKRRSQNSSYSFINYIQRDSVQESQRSAE